MKGKGAADKDVIRTQRDVFLQDHRSGIGPHPDHHLPLLLLWRDELQPSPCRSGHSSGGYHRFLVHHRGCQRHCHRRLQPSIGHDADDADSRLGRHGGGRSDGKGWYAGRTPDGWSGLHGTVYGWCFRHRPQDRLLARYHAEEAGGLGSSLARHLCRHRRWRDDAIGQDLRLQRVTRWLLRRPTPWLPSSSR